LASNLGWVFDGFEAYALILTASVALHQLLPPGQYSQIPAYAGAVIATTLCGWAIGGMLAGILADYVGRKRTMIYAILTYSIMTGLSAFSWNWTSFAVLRFLAGLAIGSEWVTGTSMTAEFWPDGARGKGSGLFQCGFGIGFFLASLLWLFIGASGPGAWRTMYLIGVLPALLTLWIRRAIPESTLWEKSNEQRRAANQRKRGSFAPIADDLALTRFTFLDLFASPAIRKRTTIAFLMATASAVGFWGISTWVPPYIGSVAASAGLSSPQWASFTGLTYNAGTIAGYISLGFLADAFGRRPVTLAYFAFSLLTTPSPSRPGFSDCRVLWLRTTNLVVDVASRALPDAHARYCFGVHLQCTSIDRCWGHAYGRQVDREIWRIWECCNDRGHDLSSGSRSWAILTRDSGQIVAGGNLTGKHDHPEKSPPS
jgi:MFS family permease